MKKNLPKITDGELKVLEVLWDKAPAAASEVVAALKERANWNRNTTYTFINRLVDKNVVKREEPGFICTPLYTRDEVRVSEARSFLDKMYDGSLKMLVTSFINTKAVSDQEIAELRRLIENSAPKK
ncbi:MAG: BlaI/MecI/CopY family transcriptional regulator [Desulfotomaculaceae bacterium]|nr:BlaI/MecI/CopY family transcriptional regulator [Desulfotomaculaceae bacterium]